MVNADASYNVVATFNDDLLSEGIFHLRARSGNGR